MSYCLGVDLGTTYSAAAVWRRGQVAPATLGHVNNVVPSVLFLTTEDELLVGDAAERRAVTEPAAVAREFKRRMGDPVPVVLRASPFPAEELTARLLEWIVSRVVELEGSWPTALAVTHPANWGEHRVQSLRRSVQIAGYRDVIFLSEPEAAAIEYAHKERVPPGDRVVVYDLGGGTFDVAVLEHDDQGGHRVLGRPQGIDHLGGMEFDALLFEHVSHLAGVDLGEVDPDDQRLLRQLAGMKAACVEAKIDLSTNTATTVLVAVGPVEAEVRVTRAEFERLIQPRVMATVDSVERALASAQLGPEELRAVLLVGGSSRVPHVARAVSAALRTQVAVDTHSKHAVAMGAALRAAGQAGLLDQNVSRLRDRTNRGAPASRSTLRRDDPAPGRRSPAASRATVRRPSANRPPSPSRSAVPVDGAHVDEPVRPAGPVPSAEPIDVDPPPLPVGLAAPVDVDAPGLLPDAVDERAPATPAACGAPAPTADPPPGNDAAPGPAIPPATRDRTGGGEQMGAGPAPGPAARTTARQPLRPEPRLDRAVPGDSAPSPSAERPGPTPSTSGPPPSRVPAARGGTSPTVTGAPDPAGAAGHPPLTPTPGGRTDDLPAPTEPPSPGTTAGLPVVQRSATPPPSVPTGASTASSPPETTSPDRWRRRGTIAPAGTGLRRDRPAHRPRPVPPAPAPAFRPATSPREGGRLRRGGGSSSSSRKAVAVPHTVLFGALAVVLVLVALLVASLL